MGKVYSILFILILFLFLLPWTTITCAGSPTGYTVSGTDLAFGKSLESPSRELEELSYSIMAGMEEMFGVSQSYRINTHETLATLVFLIAICGVLAGFLIRPESFQKISILICGAFGFILLIFLKSKLDNDCLRESAGLAKMDYHFGFYASAFLFFSIGLVSILTMTGTIGKLPENIVETPIKKSANPTFCTQCGAKLNPEDSSCHQCGRIL